MQDSLDFLVVGAGLAGAFSAYRLAERYQTGLVDAVGPAAGASGAAVGLVNVFMGRKAHTIWRHDESADALEDLLADIGGANLFRRTGIWRPALDEKQAGWFRQTADRFPDQTTFLGPDAAAERHPTVHAPHGVLEIARGGWVNITAIVEQTIAAGQQIGLQLLPPERIVEVRPSNDGLVALGASGAEIRCKRLLFAVGYGCHEIEMLRPLDLHGVKGESLRVAVQRSFADGLPCLSGTGHLVPDGSSLHLGSTYDHSFEHVIPTDDGLAEILDRVRRMVPSLPHEDILERQAGVRMGVPRTRLPMVGPLSQGERVWVLLGLGTKGILMASLLSERLVSWIDDPNSIPHQLAVRRKDA